MFVGPDDPVFAPDNGRPLDNTNILKHRILPTAKALGITLRGWHDLRRSFATLADQLGMSIGERQTLMGHLDPRMTMRYTKTPTPQAIAALQKMSKAVTGGKPN
jgi:integrase